MRSLELMSKRLERDICGLRTPGALFDELNGVDQEPLAHIRYACCYWVDHLQACQGQIGLRDNGEVHVFLQEHFLHWLEALSLMKKMSESVRVVTALLSIFTVSSSVMPNYCV
jgi:hypothetical protein